MYLYEHDRENLANKINEASGVNQYYRDNLVYKFKMLNGLELSNVEQEKIVKSIKYNQYEAKKIITENINDPLQLIDKLRKLS